MSPGASTAMHGAPDPAPVPDADRADARLLFPAVSAWAAAGLAASGSPQLSLGLAALALAAALAAGCVAVLLGRPVVVLIACLVCTSAGFAVVGLRQQSTATGPLAALARSGAGATVEVVLTGDPIPLHPRGGFARPESTPAFLIDARAERVRAGTASYRLRVPVLVLATGPLWRGLLPSTRVRLAATLAAPRAGDTVAALVRVLGAPEVVGAPSALQDRAGQLRSGLRTAAARLPADEAGLLPGLVDGDTSGLPADLGADFKVTGLTHLVAVSGSNVAAVLAAALVLTRVLPRRLRLGGRGDALVASLLLVGFVVLARPSPSVLRAAVMGLFAMAALMTGRTRPALPALSATVLLLILADPPLATSAGFALSTLASGALLVLAPGWRTSLLRRGVRPWLAEAIAVPLAAQVVCGPVIAVFAGSVSLVAVAANLVAAPAVPLATIAGVVAAVLAPLSPAAAGIAADVAALPCWWLVSVARVGSAFPAASVPWPSGVTGGLALVVVSTAALSVLRRVARRLLPVRSVSDGGGGDLSMRARTR